METIIQLLESIETADLPNDFNQLLNSVESVQGIVSQLEELANTVLIDDNGGNIWENHEVLKDHGFDIFPGEQDRFGWLSGCIQTKKGIIVYG
jgi:hypothetical protein